MNKSQAVLFCNTCKEFTLHYFDWSTSSWIEQECSRCGDITIHAPKIWVQIELTPSRLAWLMQEAKKDHETCMQSTINKLIKRCGE